MPLPSPTLSEITALIIGDIEAALADDIKANGLHRPVILHEDKILDGRNRYQACKLAGIDATFELYSGDDPLGFIISENLHRRHLNESQRAVVAAKMTNLRHGGDRRSNQSLNSDVENITAQKAADMLSVCRDNVFTAKRVMREAPEKIKDIEGGKTTLHRAKQEIKHKEVENAAPKNKKAPTGRPAGTPSSPGDVRNLMLVLIHFGVNLNLNFTQPFQSEKEAHPINEPDTHVLAVDDGHFQDWFKLAAFELSSHGLPRVAVKCSR